MSQGQQIAGAGGALLVLFLFLPWFDTPAGSFSGWEGQSSFDVYLFILAVFAISTAVTAGRGVAVPGTTPNGATALLGGVGLVIMLWLSVFDFPGGAERKFGVYLSLIAVGAIAYGAFRATLDDYSGQQRYDDYDDDQYEEPYDDRY